MDDLTQLKGKRIGVGPEGVVTQRVLCAAGVNSESATLMPLTGSAAIEALNDGRLDGIFTALAPDSSTVQPLLRDQEPYVRRNLGPYTIGDTLLRVNPKETLRCLREWSRDRDQMVRWNVAMAFSSAIGSFHWPAAKSVLERLAKGPEPLVRNAVAKAIRRCRQRYTEDVEETRLRWLKDRERSATAELVGPLKKR